MAQAKRGDVVRVHYTARVEDGAVFDTSIDRHPLRFTIGDGQVIPGFDQAVVGMQPGETKTAHIPMDEAYGPYQEGHGRDVGPQSASREPGTGGCPDLGDHFLR
jgi:peptidylprolyl isomerase